MKWAMFLFGVFAALSTNPAHEGQTTTGIIACVVIAAVCFLGAAMIAVAEALS